MPRMDFEDGSSSSGVVKPAPPDLQARVCRTLSHPLIPPYPEKIAAVIPPPPKLMPYHMDAAGSPWLAQAYWSVMERHYPTSRARYSLGQRPLEGRIGAMLLGCSRALRQYQLAPAVWVLWKVKGYARISPDKAPALNQVFAESQVHRYHGWCRSETQAYASAVSYLSDEAKQLLSAYMQFMLHIRRGTYLYEHVEYGLENHFGRGGRIAYDALLRQAQASAAQTNERLAADVMSGRCIWY